MQVSRLKREVSPEQLQTLYSACGRLPALVATGAQDGIVSRAQVLRGNRCSRHNDRVCSVSVRCSALHNCLKTLCITATGLLRSSISLHLFAMQAGAVAADFGASRTPETGAVHMACIPHCGHLSHEEAPEALLAASGSICRPSHLPVPTATESALLQRRVMQATRLANRALSAAKCAYR